MALERSIYETLERHSVADSKETEGLKRKAFSTYLEELKRYSIGRTIGYAIGGTFLGGVFSAIVFPFAPLLALFGYLGTAAGVYVGHSGQFDRTRAIVGDLEKTITDAEKSLYQRLIPQRASEKSSYPRLIPQRA